MSGLRRFAFATFAAGILLLAEGAYLPAKAALAQILLRRAWTTTGDRPVRPWPWARTWPVARLEVPALGMDEIVLAGDEGAALAFAPGHVDGTAEPGRPGNIVIAGHRDTVFAGLGAVAIGDELRLEAADGEIISYTVTGTAVIHETDLSILDPTGEPTLTLVTCYPLDAVLPGGPLRYVVRATAVDRMADRAPRRVVGRDSGNPATAGEDRRTALRSQGGRVRYASGG